MPGTDRKSAAPAASRHKNDIYGDVENRAAPARPATPAATVVLLRDGADGPEVLMLRKNAKIAFGGMWVFPGGRIDAEDRSDGADDEGAARNAATREAEEEAGVSLRPADLIWFAHWTPPPGTPVRFATWFFAARANAHAVRIDDGEIKAHQWLRPEAALADHRRGAIDLAPPTWVTLHHLTRYAPVDALLRHFQSRPARFYETRAAKREDGVRVAMWAGDAGYADWDPDRPGARHRLVMPAGGFAFENDAVDY